jgi:formylglycine-generating enzyme required for sulfatase activity
MGLNPSYFSRDGEKVKGSYYVYAPAGGKESVAGLDTSPFPVENVSFEEAAEFCKRLTERDRKAGRIGPDRAYRLPREAEWEYACRGGARTSETYHFGKAVDTGLANLGGFVEAKGSLRRTCRVGSYRPNGFGLFDVHGNVAEWCADWYDRDYYKVSPKLDPAGPAGSAGFGRVVRGGGWQSGDLRTAARGTGGMGDSHRRFDLGFRVAQVPSSRAKVPE